MASDIDWPASLAGTILLNGFDVQPTDLAIRTKFPLGTRSRQVYQSAPEGVTCAFQFLTEEQEQDFRTFWATTLGGGTQSFNLPVRAGGVYGAREVQFVGDAPHYSPADQFGQVRVTATLESVGSFNPT